MIGYCEIGTRLVHVVRKIWGRIGYCRVWCGREGNDKIRLGRAG